MGKIAMKLIIHRGTNEIGGNCMEIATDKVRVLFDIGLPLSSMYDKKPIENYKLPIRGLYKGDSVSTSGIFISHAHPDHYGLLPLIHPEIPVYLSQTTYDMLIKIQPLFNSNFDIMNLDIRVVNTGECVNLNGLKVYVFDVDHAPGAMMFRITDGIKNIFYTGDIRFHGRQSKAKNISADICKNADYLIMEGTSLGRNSQDALSEEDIEKCLVEKFDTEKLTFISCSSQNQDRMASIFMAIAALKKRSAIEKYLVIDPYTALIIEDFWTLKNNMPEPFDPKDFGTLYNVRIYYVPNSITKKLAKSKRLYKFKIQKISMDSIIKNPEHFIIKDNYGITRSILKRLPKGTDFQVIYSQWPGYLDRPNQWDDHKDKIIYLHSSGHAYTKDLQEFVKRANPKCLIPIHTERKDAFEDFFGIKTNVIDDGEILEL